MRVRTRLVLTLAGVAIPMVAGAQWMRVEIEKRAAVTSLCDFARARMEAGGREQCEELPETFRDPPRVPEHWPPRPERRDETAAARASDGPPSREVRGPNAEDTAVATREETAHAGSPRDGSLHDGSPRDESARDDSRVERGAGAQGNRPSPRVEMYAYRPDFTSANPDAPDSSRRRKSAANAGASGLAEVKSGR